MSLICSIMLMISDAEYDKCNTIYLQIHKIIDDKVMCQVYNEI